MYPSSLDFILFLFLQEIFVLLHSTQIDHIKAAHKGLNAK